jgi:hypothetical protein
MGSEPPLAIHPLDPLTTSSEKDGSESVAGGAAGAGNAAGAAGAGAAASKGASHGGVQVCVLHGLYVYVGVCGY